MPYLLWPGINPAFHHPPTPSPIQCVPSFILFWLEVLSSDYRCLWNENKRTQMKGYLMQVCSKANSFKDGSQLQIGESGSHSMAVFMDLPQGLPGSSMRADEGILSGALEILPGLPTPIWAALLWSIYIIGSSLRFHLKKLVPHQNTIWNHYSKLDMCWPVWYVATEPWKCG